MFRFEIPRSAGSKESEKMFTPVESGKNDVTVYFEDGVTPEHLSEAALRAHAYMNDLESIIGNNERQIDFGGAATIFEDGDLVLKVMNNRHLSSEAHKYNLGVSPLEEFHFMEQLHNFAHAGVRSPAPLMCIESGSTSILIMERLHAINLQHVLNGTAELPEGFDYDAFYDAVSDYLDMLHKTKGITHNDLFPRNFMIDKATSMPYVIDFGRAKHPGEHGDTPSTRDTKDDWDKYDAMYEELEMYRNNDEVKVREITGRHEEYILSHFPKVHYSSSIILQAEKQAAEGMDEDEIFPLVIGDATSIVLTRDPQKVTGALQFTHQEVTYYVGKIVTS